jgi:Protein of unknown function (DUF1579)
MRLKQEVFMRKQLLAYAAATAMASGAVAVLAQAPPAPKPGPEQKALEYYVGNWTGQAELKPGPFGPGGKMTSTDTCEWFAGGFHVICRGEGSGVMGNMKTLGIISYSGGDKAYKFYAVDSMGTAELSTGTKSGDTWTFSSDSNYQGMAFKSRYTLVEVSPTSYTFKWEMSQDGTKWATVVEGTSKKSGT